MPSITGDDFETMLDCAGRLYEVRTLAHFPIEALTQILRLVGADSSTFNYVAPSVPRVVTTAIPDLPDEPEKTARFAQYLPEHKPLHHFLITGDRSAVKFSDFQTVREYHRLPLYQEFYRELEYEDQFTFMLFPPGAELIGVSLARRKRSFTERDREVLNLLQPQVARAYRHVERIGLLNRALGQTQDVPVARATSVVLDAQDRPVEFAPEAQRWIDGFFPERARIRSRLPAAIQDWLRRSAKGGKGTALPGLVRERAGQRLRLNVMPGDSDGGRLLILGLETIPGRFMPSSHGLTKREVEVLLQVEHGKTNGEISAALGISPLTVRCHLEHIFEKLKAPSRTAAVTRFRTLCAAEV